MKILSFIRKLFIDAFITVALAVVVFSILSDVWSGSYVIHAIVVPQDFAQKTQTGDGVAAALKSELGRLLRDAQTGVAIKSTVPNASEPDIQVAGTSVPLRYVAGLGRSLLKIPYSNISGQLSMASGDMASTREGCEGRPGRPGPPPEGTWVHLVLQLEDATTGPFFDCVGAYPDIIERAAWATLSIVDPFANAILLNKSGDAIQREEAILRVRKAIADAERDEPPALLQHFLPFPIWPNRIPRAHLTLAEIYLSARNDRLAADEFARADEAFADRSPSKSHSPAAEDGLSIISLNELQNAIRAPNTRLFERTRAAACRSLAFEPHYDAGQYHLAQAYDLASRSLLNPNLPAHACKAALEADSACRIYEGLLHDYPRFAVAYDQQAVMMLQRLHEIHVEGRDGCSPLNGAALNERADRLASYIDRSFVNAILIDGDRNYEPWLQRGILFFEVQNPSRFVDGMGVDQRIDALKRAISLYLHAADLRPGDGYTLQRLGEALAALSALSNVSIRAELKGQAAAAFCLALPLTQDSDKAAIAADIETLAPRGSVDCSKAKRADLPKGWPRYEVADGPFVSKWAGVGCAEVRGGAIPMGGQADAGPATMDVPPAVVADRGARLDAGQVCRSPASRPSLRHGRSASARDR